MKISVLICLLVRDASQLVRYWNILVNINLFASISCYSPQNYQKYYSMEPLKEENRTLLDDMGSIFATVHFFDDKRPFSILLWCVN